MSSSFDPYHEWLGIPPRHQPPHHYRLLGIEPFEDDPKVIENAADQRMVHLRSFQNSGRAEDSQRLLNEVAAARLCLLNAKKKADYDRQLRAQQLAEPEPTQAAGVSTAAEYPLRPPQPVLARELTAAPDVLTGPWPPDSAAPLPGLQAGFPFPPRRRPHPPLWRHPVMLLIGGGVLLGVFLVILAFLTDGGPGALHVDGVERVAGGADGDDAGVDSGVVPPSENGDANSPTLPSGNEAEIPLDPGPAEHGGAPTRNPTEEGKAERQVSQLREPPPVPAPVDLLALIDPERDGHSGDWRIKDGALHSAPGRKVTLLKIPYQPPADYRLEVELIPLVHTGFGVGLVIGGRQCVANVNHRLSGEYVTALGKLDDTNTQYNETARRGQVITSGELTRLVYVVRSERMHVTCNGRLVMRWEGDPRRLSVPPDCRIPDSRPLFVGTWPEHRWRITRMLLIPLQPAVKASPPPAAEIAQARARIRASFSEDLAVESANDQQSLGNRLFDAAVLADNQPARQFALLLEARDAFRRGAAADLAAAAVGAVVRRFEVNSEQVESLAAAGER